MASSALLVLLVISCIAVISGSPLLGFRGPNCRKCHTIDECFSAPEGGCEFGVYKDSCNFINCNKGPGEACSPTRLCVSGLSCLCGKCTGCYLDNEGATCHIPTSACMPN